MLRLSWDQYDAIEQLVVRRRAVFAAEVLAEAWPTVVERLRERWPGFVEAALLQAHRHGIDDGVDLAGYASLWCIWGAAFEDRPGFEWAREIVADPRRGPSLKVHQLLHRTREELLRRAGPASPGAPPVVTPAQLEAALRSVELQMARGDHARSVFERDEPRPLFKACDIESVDLMVAEPEGLSEYRHLPVGWQRVPVPKLELPHVHWTMAPEAPLLFAVPSQRLRGGPPARLNLRVQGLGGCDPRTHPEVAHLSAQGRLAWTGRDAQRLSLALYAPPPAADAPAPGIGALAPGDLQEVTISACGQRDAGAPFGTGRLQIRVVPATQWLTELRHPAWPALAWPGGTEAAPFTPPAVRLEADGANRPVPEWQRGWAELPVAFRAGMDKLFNAWLRAVDPAGPKLEVEAAPLVGEAALTWGWKRTAADTVAMRVAGRIDLIACALDLKLSGDMVVAGARARVTLAAKGRVELRTPIDEGGDVTAAPGQDLKNAQRSFRFPFRVEVEPIPGATLATLGDAATPEFMTGALVGECGLKPRPDGAGFRWFYALRCEPAAVRLGLADPVLGSSTLQRELLPAQPLVDWFAG